jgi:hypothetical protein
LAAAGLSVQEEGGVANSITPSQLHSSGERKKESHRPSDPTFRRPQMSRIPNYLDDKINRSSVDELLLLNPSIHLPSIRVFEILIQRLAGWQCVFVIFIYMYVFL